MRFYKEQSELFEGIQNGDADAFEYVFKTYYPRLRNYANRFVNDSDDLEDILQNVSSTCGNAETASPLSPYQPCSSQWYATAV